MQIEPDSDISEIKLVLLTVPKGISNGTDQNVPTWIIWGFHLNIASTKTSNFALLYVLRPSHTFAKEKQPLMNILLLFTSILCWQTDKSQLC